MADHPQKQYQIEPHHEVKERFADQIGFMMFDGSTLKIDFVAVRMKGSNPPALPEGHVVSRLVLSLNGAKDLINQIGKLAAQLTESGLIKPEQGQVTQEAKPN